ncbi:3 exoribonuclease domain 1 domain-containing protein, partial [Cystoisospora suis]
MEGISETVDSSCSFSGNRGVSHQADKEVPASSGVCTPRPDGRSSGMELRPVSVQLGLIKNADGSARISQGFTTVTSIVLGPLEAPLGPKCLSSTCYFHVIVRSVGSLPVRSQRISSGGSLLTGRDPLSSLSSSSSWKSSSLDQKTEWERSMECQLHALLQHMVIGAKYPRSLVQVSLLISQDDGCLESVCINAALASLLDAGIGLRYRAWSIGLVHLMVEETRDKLISSRDKEKKKEEEEGERKQETEWMLDPCREEEEDGRTEGEKIFVLEPQTG